MPFDYKLPVKLLPLSVDSQNGGHRPNYIIFMPDQLRYDSLGCTAWPNALIKTPNIDAFAKRGSLSTNCFTRALLSLTEYGFLETPEYMPNFGKGDVVVDESIWGRLFYRGLRDASKAVDYDEAVAEEPYFSMYKRTSIETVEATPDKKTGYEPKYMSAIRELYGTHRATDKIWKQVKATYYVTIFFTDHGEYLRDHGLIEKWPSGLSDSLVHEPLIVGGAGLPEGKVIDAMTEMAGLLPTILEISGVPESFPHNGSSWIPLLCGSATDHKAFAFSEGGFLLSDEPLLERSQYPYDLKAALQHQDSSLVGKVVSIRDKTWTFIYRLYEPAELYHRLNDSHELHNLAADPAHQDIVNRLKQAILEWMLESSGNMSWKSDPRFLSVDMKSPREQLEERLQQAAEVN